MKRSKLEKYTQRIIRSTYPRLKVLYNTRSIISPLELDIYIPSLRLAFEINGPVHHSPIYGTSVLASVQHKDTKKLDECSQANIDLIQVDTSKLTGAFSEDAAWPFVALIINTIDAYLQRLDS